MYIRTGGAGGTGGTGGTGGIITLLLLLLLLRSGARRKGREVLNPPSVIKLGKQHKLCRTSRVLDDLGDGRWAGLGAEVAQLDRRDEGAEALDDVGVG